MRFCKICSPGNIGKCLACGKHIIIEESAEHCRKYHNSFFIGMTERA